MLHALLELLVPVPEDVLPAGREVESSGLGIPVPDTIVGTPNDQGVPFLAFAERRLYPAVFKRVADRAFEGLRFEPVFGQIIHRPGLHDSRSV